MSCQEQRAEGLPGMAGGTCRPALPAASRPSRSVPEGSMPGGPRGFGWWEQNRGRWAIVGRVQKGPGSGLRLLPTLRVTCDKPPFLGSVWVGAQAPAGRRGGQAHSPRTDPRFPVGVGPPLLLSWASWTLMLGGSGHVSPNSKLGASGALGSSGGSRSSHWRFHCGGRVGFLRRT